MPSRQQPGSFYALPQSPQLFKQLLMVAGIDRYYQMARCLRDEDLRADRQYEFMQLDAEMSFASQDDVHEAIGAAVIAAARSAGQDPGEIVKITWHDAMNRFGTDKPDMRFAMELVELTDAFSATEFKAFAGAPTIKGINASGKAADYGRNKLDALTDKAKSMGAKGLVWLKVADDGSLESPVAKFLSAAEQAELSERLDAKPGDLLLIVADEWAMACEVLGTLRNDLGRPPVHEGPYRYLWVVDFPLFVGVDAVTGRPKPGHHPFTQPHPDDVHLLESDPLKVRSQAYDLVLNGWELGSGSIRIHQPEMQSRIFRLLGISDEEANKRFGFFLNPFRYGAPPHGGFAFGIDRLVAILAGEENIREVIAFPKTQSGMDPMTNAPTPVDPKQLARPRHPHPSPEDLAAIFGPPDTVPPRRLPPPHTLRLAIADPYAVLRASNAEVRGSIMDRFRWAERHDGLITNAHRVRRRADEATTRAANERPAGCAQVRRGVSVVNGVPPSWRQAVRAVLLSHVDRVAGSHWTSAHASRWRNELEVDKIHVITDLGHRIVLDGVVSHRSGLLEEGDLVRRDGMLCTSPLRTVIDLSGPMTARTGQGRRWVPPSQAARPRGIARAG